MHVGLRSPGPSRRIVLLLMVRPVQCPSHFWLSERGGDLGSTVSGVLLLDRGHAFFELTVCALIGVE